MYSATGKEGQIMKVHEWIILSAVFVVAIFSIWTNIRIDKKFVATGLLIEDARLLVFSSLDDVDTLVYPDRFIIFERGFDSRKLFINTLKNDSGNALGTELYWNIANQTIHDILDIDTTNY